VPEIAQVFRAVNVNVTINRKGSNFLPLASEVMSVPAASEVMSVPAASHTGSKSSTVSQHMSSKGLELVHVMTVAGI
jgi:anaerobic glycerol-3-phosphate dehydrogenase